MSNLHMSLMAAAAVAYYPDQGATASSTLHHAATSRTGTDFPTDGTQDAIIYGIFATQGAAAAVTIDIVARTGSASVARVSVSGDVPAVVDFGPQGLRVPGGFVVTPSATTPTITIIYDRVASNA
jgi:hypothetical protein